MENLEGNLGEMVEDQAPNSSEMDEGFFESLENDVNGMIVDEVTQQSVGPEQVTQPKTVGSDTETTSEEVVSLKRYKDSSREAQKWRDRYKDVEPFVPILEAMKSDSGLVEHVREYLVDGGKTPKSIQDDLGLDDDFVFDSQEAMTEPDSDSAKLMNAHVDRMVQGRVGQILESEKQRASKMQEQRYKAGLEKEFREKRGMSEEQFEAFKTEAQQHTLTLDDIELILNKDKVNTNAAQSAKKDMLTQMKNVRDIPTSASGANSQATEKAPESQLFDGILGLDEGLDNLFG